MNTLQIWTLETLTYNEEESAKAFALIEQIVSFGIKAIRFGREASLVVLRSTFKLVTKFTLRA